MIIFSRSVIHILFWLSTIIFSIGTVWYIALASMRRARMGALNTQLDRKSYMHLFLSSCCVILLSVPEIYAHSQIVNLTFFNQKLLDTSNNILLITRPLFSTINTIVYVMGSSAVRRSITYILSNCYWGKCSPAKTNSSGGYS